MTTPHPADSIHALAVTTGLAREHIRSAARHVRAAWQIAMSDDPPDELMHDALATIAAALDEIAR